MESDECEFDSTWEDEHHGKTQRKKMYSKRHRNMNASKDMQDFRHSCRFLDYEDDEPVHGHFYNLEFYRGRIRSVPDNIQIDEFHKQWWGQYKRLEDVHSYIQWLFPIQEQGLNRCAHVLTKEEIKYFRRDKQAQRNLMKSYEVMLDFYGLRLVNKDTGEVKRADNWRPRFRDLNRHSHNNLRITRILKCLGTLGLEHYQAPLVKFFLDETLVKGELPRVKQSVLDYFMFAVLDKSKRRELVRYAFKHFRPQQDFVWGPKKILRKETAKEGEQQRVKTHKSMHEMSKIHASPLAEDLRSGKRKNDHHKGDKNVRRNTLIRKRNVSLFCLPFSINKKKVREPKSRPEVRYSDEAETRKKEKKTTSRVFTVVT